jgi:hypothetical protein
VAHVEAWVRAVGRSLRVVALYVVALKEWGAAVGIPGLAIFPSHSCGTL